MHWNSCNSGEAVLQEMPDISLRTAGPRDAAALALLVNSAYRGDSSRVGWTTEADLLGGQRTDLGEITRLIEADGSRLLLAIQATEIIGSVHLHRIDETTAYLGMLVIKPVLQGQGLGSRLMQAAETWVRREWNARRAEMQVITLREELIAYYERRGYRYTGEIRPFPSEPEFGLPKVGNLQFVVLEKWLD
jgi:GNAT superfamily N-acetyltransferase